MAAAATPTMLMTASTALRWLVSIAAAACAAALFWAFHGAYRQAQETRQWPQRMAVIAETVVLRGDGGQVPQGTHCAHSVVQFQWQGHVHTTRLQRSEPVCGMEPLVHQRVADHWPPGREVLVHVNPERPGQVHSADIHLAWMEYLFLLAGCLLALVPIGLFCAPPRGAAAPDGRSRAGAVLP